MLHIITHRNWMAEDLGATQHFGFDLVDTTDFIPGEDALWAPGHHISLQHIAGLPWQYQDMPWWDPPKELLGRRIIPVSRG